MVDIETLRRQLVESELRVTQAGLAAEEAEIRLERALTEGIDATLQQTVLKESHRLLYDALSSWRTIRKQIQAKRIEGLLSHLLNSEIALHDELKKCIGKYETEKTGILEKRSNGDESYKEPDLAAITAKLDKFKQLAVGSEKLIADIAESV